jgi:hypothetical protein
MVGEVMNDADDVLAHSEDEGEWEDEPVAIERRPSGSQVLSARIPRGLADGVFATAARRGMKPSDIVRAAIETYLNPPVFHVIKVQPSDRVRFFRTVASYETTNPVVTTENLPPLRLAL